MRIENYVRCTEIFPKKLADNQQAYYIETKAACDPQQVLECPALPRLQKGECEQKDARPICTYPMFWEVWLTYGRPVRISPPKKVAWYKRLFRAIS